jgi:anaerobic selenocysteine-containing dehydrogenase
VAVDFYVNETTRHADVILPPTTSLERDHYDLVFLTLAVRNTARFTPAVLPKPEGARHDWEIFRDLTLRLASRLEGPVLPRDPRSLPRSRSAVRRLRRRLVQEGRMRLSPTRLVDLLLRTGRRRLSVAALLAHPDGLDLGPLEPCLPGRLQTRDRRIDAAPAVVLADLERLASAGDRPVPELLLIGRRHQRDNNSWGHNTTRLTRGRPRHQLLMHPADLAARDLGDGDRVRVSSRVGAVEVEVAASEDMMPGVVSLPHGYGHARDGVLLGHATALPGVSLNDLTDPERLDVTGNAAFNGTPVDVAAAG